MKRTTGFTLVEMLMVIGVVMLLMAIIFAIMGPVIQLTYRKRCEDSLQQIGAALKEYKKENGAYPNPSQVHPVQAVASYIHGGKILTCAKAPKPGPDEEAIACSYNIQYNYYGYAADTMSPVPLTSLREARTTYELLDNPATGKKDYFLKTIDTPESVPNTDFPGLVNPNADPDTIVFACTYHGGDKGEFIVLRLNGETEHVKFEKLTPDEQTNFWALSKRYNH